MNQDKILRLYTRLVALKDNLPTRADVEEKYVREYHSILSDLESEIKTDLSEFKVPESEIDPTVVSWNMLSGDTTYSKDRYCDKPILLGKLDSVLSYFKIRYLSEPTPKIGFGD